MEPGAREDDGVSTLLTVALVLGLIGTVTGTVSLFILLKIANGIDAAEQRRLDQGADVHPPGAAKGK